MTEWLYTTNEWGLLGLLLLLTVGSVECGAVLGRRHRARGAGEAAGFVSSLAAPSMGLLALMIGFTFVMAVARFDARKAAVLEEANAIGTAALRGRMLAEPYAAAVAPLFKEYAKLRVASRGFRLTSAAAVQGLRHAAGIQEELWRDAMAAAKENPNVVPTGLFIQALNTMIDVHAKRLMVARDTVPAGVFLMLAGIAVVALGFSGYGAVQAAGQHRIAMLIVAVMIAGVIMLVFDLDNPQAGIISVSQQPLLDLIRSMQ